MNESHDRHLERVLELVDGTLFATADRHLTEPELTILRGVWQGWTYDQMADRSQYRMNYLMRDVGPKLWKLLTVALGEEVGKGNFRAVAERYAARHQPPTILLATPPYSLPQASDRPTLDWSDAPDASLFYGRQEELQTLERWILTEECRLIALLGLQGIGKTTLAVELVKRVQPQFQRVIWRSLRTAPALTDLLTDLLQALGQPHRTAEPQQLLASLMALVRSQRCLIVLDNLESLLQSGELAGHYREGYETYGDFLQHLGEESHQSCLVLTSLEKPREIARLSGKTLLPVRELLVKGLQDAEAKQLLQTKSLVGKPADWTLLIRLYRGNPLALKLIATTIEEVFNGKIAEFLQQGMLIFGDIPDLLYQPFQRLSAAEKELLYWLAITQQPLSLLALQKKLWLPLPLPTVVETMTSLGRRSLTELVAEAEETRFTLQPVVQQYVLEQFISQVVAELVSYQQNSVLEQVSLLKSHDLEITETLVSQVVDRCSIKVANQTRLFGFIREISQTISANPYPNYGYLSNNIDNLLREFRRRGVLDHELLPELQKPDA